ncbi:SoxR reducing system RseC family protein [Psychromonas sp. MME2]|uniref:SoxR reducing system RseC family protein n=1 Tax=unclassified Psychromonas TaxID=2614957 RepID=UPI00339CC77C
MVKETARIIAVEEHQTGKVAILECVSKSACSACSNKSSCGVGAVSKAFTDKTHRFTVPYASGMKIDEYIDLEINGRDLISSAIYVYLLPIVCFIAAALIAQFFFPTDEGKVILSAFLSAATVFMVIKLVSPFIFTEKKMNNVIEAKIKQGD